jgi:hypothetical protein
VWRGGGGAAAGNRRGIGVSVGGKRIPVFYYYYRNPVHHDPRGGLKKKFKTPHSRVVRIYCHFLVLKINGFGGPGCGRRGAGSKRIHPFYVAFVSLCCSANSAAKVTPLNENAALNPLPLHDGR